METGAGLSTGGCAQPDNARIAAEPVSRSRLVKSRVIAYTRMSWRPARAAWTIWSSAKSGTVRQGKFIEGAGTGRRLWANNPRRNEFQASAERQPDNERRARSTERSICGSCTPRRAAKAKPVVSRYGVLG